MGRSESGEAQGCQSSQEPACLFFTSLVSSFMSLSSRQEGKLCDGRSPIVVASTAPGTRHLVETSRQIGEHGRELIQGWGVIVSYNTQYIFFLRQLTWLCSKELCSKELSKCCAKVATSKQPFKTLIFSISKCLLVIFLGLSINRNGT